MRGTKLLRNGKARNEASETGEASEASTHFDSIREPQYTWTFHFGFAVLSLVEYEYPRGCESSTCTNQVQSKMWSRL
jgi:hypothetical protein